MLNETLSGVIPFAKRVASVTDGVMFNHSAVPMRSAGMGGQSFLTGKGLATRVTCPCFRGCGLLERQDPSAIGKVPVKPFLHVFAICGVLQRLCEISGMRLRLLAVGLSSWGPPQSKESSHQRLPGAQAQSDADKTWWTIGKIWDMRQARSTEYQGQQTCRSTAPGGNTGAACLDDTIYGCLSERYVSATIYQGRSESSGMNLSLLHC